MHPGAIFGRRVREIRNRHGWTQAELAERLTDLGRPMDQAVVARLESKKPSTRAVNVSLVDVLAFSAALGVSPVFLFLPLDDDVPVQVAPKLELPARHVRSWVKGNVPLRADDDHRIWETERDAQTLGLAAAADLLRRSVERSRREAHHRLAERRRRAEESAEYYLAESTAEIEKYERRGETVPASARQRHERLQRHLEEIRQMTVEDWRLHEGREEEMAADMYFDLLEEEQ